MPPSIADQHLERSLINVQPTSLLGQAEFNLFTGMISFSVLFCIRAG
jgi:hypothetical protein